jgi:dTMP kinase
MSAGPKAATCRRTPNRDTDRRQSNALSLHLMKGLFITFEGTEGSGKSTQIPILGDRLRSMGHRVQTLREPGGTPIGEEIRHTLKHSKANEAMTPEAELLLMNASRAQLVREIIRPALARGEIVLSDRFYDSTTAYQGYGRELDLTMVKSIVDAAVGDTRPDITLLFLLPYEVAEARRLVRQPTLPMAIQRDRIEEAGRSFFERAAKGYEAIAAAEPQRVKKVNATGTVPEISARIWKLVEPLVRK